MTNNMLEHFLGHNSHSTPKHKTTYVCNKEDFDLLREVFPEGGFITYFPGACIKVLADECRKHNIESFNDRSGSPLASIGGVLSSINIDGQELRPNDGCGD